MEKTYRIEYWEHTSTTIDVVAETEEEALEKAKEIVECGELDCSTIEHGDCGYESMRGLDNGKDLCYVELHR